MNWFGLVMSFLKTDTGKSTIGYIGVGLVAIILAVYIWLLRGNLEDALESKKLAENNIILISKEFNILYDKHTNILDDYKKQKEFHSYSISILNKKHSIELTRAIKETKMKEKINEVKKQDDGNISVILGSTLNALRMYD